MKTPEAPFPKKYSRMNYLRVKVSPLLPLQAAPVLLVPSEPAVWCLPFSCQTSAFFFPILSPLSHGQNKMSVITFWQVLDSSNLDNIISCCL